MDAKEHKLIALEVIAICADNLAAKGMDEAADYLTQILMRLTLKFVKEYQDDIPDGNGSVN